MERRTDNDVLDFLSSVWEARFDMDRASREIALAEAECQRVTAQITGAPGGGGDRHKDAAWAALADFRALLEEQHRLALERKAAVERFILQLPDPKHRAVLRLRYVDTLRWPVVLERLHDYDLYYSERQMHRIHGAALTAARAKWAEQQGDQET